jgi:hypothetical protein
MELDDGAWRMLMREATSESTSASYESLLGRLTRAGCALNVRGFAKYLNEERERTSHKTVDKLRSALRWHMITSRQGAEWHQHELEIDYTVTAYKRLHPEEPRLPKGAIDREKLCQMVTWLQRRGEIALARALRYMWCYGLRQINLPHLQLQHFERDEDEDGNIVWKLVCPAQKVRLGESKSVEGRGTETHWPDPEEYYKFEARDLTFYKDNGFPEEMPMFSTYSHHHAREMIKSCARELGWSNELDWNGAHCLRHGSAVEAKALGGLSEVRRRTAHAEGSACLEMYSWNNEDRAKKGKIQKKDAAASRAAVERRKMKAARVLAKAARRAAAGKRKGAYSRK